MAWLNSQNGQSYGAGRGGNFGTSASSASAMMQTMPQHSTGNYAAAYSNGPNCAPSSHTNNNYRSSGASSSQRFQKPPGQASIKLQCVFHSADGIISDCTRCISCRRRFLDVACCRGPVGGFIPEPRSLASIGGKAQQSSSASSGDGASSTEACSDESLPTPPDWDGTSTSMAAKYNWQQKADAEMWGPRSTVKTTHVILISQDHQRAHCSRCGLPVECIVKCPNFQDPRADETKA